MNNYGHIYYKAKENIFTLQPPLPNSTPLRTENFVPSI